MSFDVFGLLLQASPVVKLVMLGLVVMSAVSWTIIASKWIELKRAMKDSDAFLDVYHQETYEEALEAARLLDRSPLCAIYMVGCTELGHLAKRPGGIVSNGEELRRVERHLHWSAIRESQRLERGLTFLATTGNNAPFIGLFGTVVGIIQTFQSIGQAGNASLAVVGPGMAEALIATAMGLLAAIPASIFFNIFARRIDDIHASIELFRSEFQGDLEDMAREAVGSAFNGPRR